jgi:hypothetical protein
MPGMNIPYQIRRTGRRSRSISVRVHFDGTVRVGAPNWVGMAEIREVVNEHAAWITERLAKVRAALPRYHTGAPHPYLGRAYPLRVVTKSKPDVSFGRGGFVVGVRERADEHVRAELSKWYRARAGELLPRRLERMAARAPWVARVPALRIRRMRAQWGSCCETGLITLNARLVKAPLRLIDYVILHELVHLKHHDHGRGFERLMDAHMPDWRRRRRELNTLGERLLYD